MGSRSWARHFAPQAAPTKAPRPVWCLARGWSTEASAAAISVPRRGGQPRRLRHTNGSPQRWQVCMRPPMRHGWPLAAATRQDRTSKSCYAPALLRDAMSHATSIGGVSLQPRTLAGRGLVRIGARLRSTQLDAALAQGADPWSTPELMARASRLGSRSERRNIAAGLHRLLALATGHQRESPFCMVRHAVVLEQRDALLALADRMFQPAPVNVAVIAQLALLLSDSSSPVYAGGRPPPTLVEVTTRCLASVSENAATD